MTQLTLPKPDDWHVHLREGALLSGTLALAAKQFGRCVAMPNLQQPLTSAEHLRGYADAIQQQMPKNAGLEILLTLFLTDEMPADQIDAAKNIENFFAVKWYPAYATTNSNAGVRDIQRAFRVLARMEELDVPLLVHGETGEAETDVFDREAAFLDRVLPAVREHFPKLRITLEHISSAASAAYIRQAGDRTAATVTPQHLLFNRNHFLRDGINPHLYCKPILKREADRTALCDLVCDGAERVFLGSDSAPHPRSQKESSCGCAGVFSAPCLMEAYAHIFDELGCLDKLEDFACRKGAAFYGYPPNTGNRIRLKKERWQVPTKVRLEIEGGEGDIDLVPMAAGEHLNWRVID